MFDWQEDVLFNFYGGVLIKWLLSYLNKHVIVSQSLKFLTRNFKLVVSTICTFYLKNKNIFLTCAIQVARYGCAKLNAVILHDFEVDNNCYFCVGGITRSNSMDSILHDE